jgi:hypothetical protein
MVSGRGVCLSVLLDGSEADRAVPAVERGVLATVPCAVSEVPCVPAAVAQAVSRMLAVSTVIETTPARVSFMGPDVSAAHSDPTVVSVRFP